MYDENSFKSKKANDFVVTEIIEKKSNYINPVIVNFQNGELDLEDSKSFTVSFDKNESGKTQIEVESFYGHKFQETENESVKRRQFIAIRNRKTHKVKLVEVDSALLIHSSLIPLEKPEESVEETDFGTDYAKLNKKFGGKKIAHKLQQRERLNIDSVFKEDEIKEAVEDLKKDTSVMLSNSTVESDSILELLPPRNGQAKEVADVYSMADILNDEEMEELSREVIDSGLSKNKFSPKDYSEFFRFCYDAVSKSNVNRDKKLVGIMYIETLIKFLKEPSKQLLTRKKNYCPYSTVIQNKLLRDFCVNSGRSVTRPLTMRDKCFCYIIALCLICCNYQVNLKLLSTTASIPLPRLVRLGKAVGVVPASKDDVMYILKLPLPALPASSMAKTKRK